MRYSWYVSSIIKAIFVLIACAILVMIYQRHLSYDEKKIANLSNIIPIAVIGGGPAGLSAGLYGARAGFHTVVFQGYEPGGQLTETTMVENWPGVPADHGPQVMKKIEEQTKKFGAIFAAEEIKKVDLSSWPFKLLTDNDVTVHALTVIIATGATPRKLGIPGETEYWGHGVMSCPKCDAPFTKDKRVVIAGGGDTAIEYALQIIAYAKEITIFMRSEKMRASDFMQRKLNDYPQIHLVYNKVIEKITGDGEQVQAVQLRDLMNDERTTFPTDSVFLAIGFEPNTQLVSGQVAIEKNGCIAVHCPSQATTVKGVYAAGTVTDPTYRQAVTCAADGTKAALDAINFLFNFDKEAYTIDKEKLYTPKPDQETT